jgi:mannose-1-phosphate guanylyltransferase/mannose-6-phosphate isomerase
LRKQARQAAAILLEPVGRNTAPAVALAALAARELDQGEDAVLLILAADHVLRDSAAFGRAITTGLAQADAGSLVTFGIVPRSPETGYGYIKASSMHHGLGDVKQFVEKPDRATAESYLAEGDYYWNSGMFMFRASRYLEQLVQFRPDIAEAVQAAWQGRTGDMDFTRLDRAAFEACPDDSIDYAIMEKTTQGKVVALDAGWSDVGSWSSLWEESAPDDNGNVIRGDVLTQDAHDNLLFSDYRLIAAVGVDNLVVVNTPDAVLVANKDRVQDVKLIVKQLEQARRSEASLHREVSRPWGSYDSIDMGARFQVKRITVKPGAKLSLQMHHHRAEHWIVVSGTALVTIGDDTRMLSENQSTYIPIGVTHRLENPGVLPLEMIEVQSGSYLGEDDIVRFEDTYGRA